MRRVVDLSRAPVRMLTPALAFVLWLALPSCVLAQSTAVPIPKPPPTSLPEPTDPPPAASEVPATSSAPAATAPSAATQDPATPRAPSASEDEDDEDAPPAAPQQPVGPTPEARPTRTRRPTRTPRTTPTVSPTPPVAGGLRLSLSAEPAVPVLRERASFLLELRNQSQVDLTDLTVELVVPDVLLDYRVEARVGETARAGALVRWYLPSLPRDSATTLRISGSVARSGSGRTQLCALLLSAGAPLEHCASFEVLSSRVQPGVGASASPPSSNLPTAEPQRSPLEEAPGALASGWTLLLLGLGILGAWLGLQLRGRREPRAAAPPAPAAETDEATQD
jgi:hypothetical protein